MIRFALALAAAALVALPGIGPTGYPVRATGNIGAQSIRAHGREAASDSALVALAAHWDSLYHAQRFFSLRSAIAAYPDTEAPAVRLYAGLVAHEFGQDAIATALLRPLLETTQRALTKEQSLDATVAEASSEFRMFRYRESGEVYQAALHRWGRMLDSATLASMSARAAMGAALAKLPPQHASWIGVSDFETVATGGTAYAVTVTINGEPVRGSFGALSAVPITIVDETTAESTGVRLLSVDLPVLMPSGRSMPARVGVIDSLGIGAARIYDVVVMVVPDSEVARQGRSMVGELGLPVLRALGAITFTPDGAAAFSSPGVIGGSRGEDAGAPFVLANGKPVVAAVVRGDTSLFALDLLASRSVVSAAARSIGIGSQSLLLDSVSSRSGDANMDAGVLGRDAFRGTAGVTLDFGTMRARLVRAHVAPLLPQLVYDPTPVPAPPRPVTENIAFMVLLLALFVIPKVLQRWRVPTAITSLLMGVGARAYGFFEGDPTLRLMSTFGIVALFLFAGLDIDGRELRRNAATLGSYGGVWAGIIALAALLIVTAFGFAFRPALLIALAVLTPSTGFILSSLSGFGLDAGERFTVKTYAIASELLALGILFFVLQATSATRLTLAMGAMLAIVILIPLAFRLFARLVAPYAPRSEFAFLLMVAVLCAYATWRLGVYYLVGAFIVGVAAQRFREHMPSMSSEKLIDALESFGSVFIPFYFFAAGTHISRDQLTWSALALGLLLTVALVPLRILFIALQRYFSAGEHIVRSRRIGLALAPTLVFTLVINEILLNRFEIATYVTGGLVLYTILNTAIPGLMLQSAPPEFENVEALPVSD